MSERKIQRHVIVIRQLLTATGTFTVPIFVPFVPDEVKVKHLGFYFDATRLGLFTVRCDTLVNQINSNLGMFMDPTMSFSGITYPLTSSPNGSHTFSIYEVGEDGPVTAL